MLGWPGFSSTWWETRSYGFFRDELYFIACGRHPAFGYVDQPPLVPALAAISQAWGPSLVLLRALAALFAGASLYVTCLLARELGAGAFGQALAALAAFLSPVLMSFGMKLSTDTPGLVLWPLAALLVLRLARGADPRGWLAVGAALGVAAEAKYSVIFFALALLLGLLGHPPADASSGRRGFWRESPFACCSPSPAFCGRRRRTFPCGSSCATARRARMWC